MTAANFLQHFGPTDEEFFIQTFDDKKKGNRAALSERRWTLQELQDKSAALSMLNQKHNAGVYFCVNGLTANSRRSSDNVEAVRAFFLDLDGSPVQPVMNWLLQPNIVVRTSADRYHCYWLLDDYYPEALKLFKPIQRWLAEKFKGDKSISDLCRVMRLPGFHNMKHEPFMVTWTHWNSKPFKLKELTDVMDFDKINNSDNAVEQRNNQLMAGAGMAEWMAADEMASYAGLGGSKNIAADLAFDADRLRSALRQIPSDDYDVWLRVGMALQGAAMRDDAELSEDEAYEYWLDWSATSSKFDDSVIEEKWQGLNARGEVGLGTVFELAKQHGWSGLSGRTPEEVKATMQENRGTVAKNVIDITTPEGKLKALRFK